MYKNPFFWEVKSPRSHGFPMVFLWFVNHFRSPPCSHHTHLFLVIFLHKCINHPFFWGFPLQTLHAGAPMATPNPRRQDLLSHVCRSARSKGPRKLRLAASMAEPQLRWGPGVSSGKHTKSYWKLPFTSLIYPLIAWWCSLIFHSYDNGKHTKSYPMSKWVK